ncbi:hypothetical protein NL676_019291 [Syzygium grande]|nr:hypothetical protein NL676_019291 [Syzygium grande]
MSSAASSSSPSSFFPLIKVLSPPELLHAGESDHRIDRRSEVPASIVIGAARRSSASIEIPSSAVPSPFRSDQLVQNVLVHLSASDWADDGAQSEDDRWRCTCTARASFPANSPPSSSAASSSSPSSFFPLDAFVLSRPSFFTPANRTTASIGARKASIVIGAARRSSASIEIPSSAVPSPFRSDQLCACACFFL